MYWALAGVLVPVAILIAVQIENWTKVLIWRLDLVSLALWPSSIMLMALEVIHQPWWWPPFVYTVSISINVILYSVVGTLVWFLWSFYDHYFK